jgi:pimeloyl-ACP methyl ester carboxylesterase
MVLIDAVGYPLEKSDRPIAFRLATLPVLNNLLTFITPRSVVEQSVKDVYADDSRVTDELVQRYFELSLRPGNRQAFIDRSRPFEVDSAFTQIPSIAHPTLILWGAEDYFVPIAMGRAFERDLPNDTLVIVPNAGHVPMEELPMETAGMVMGFLSKN